MVADLLGPRIDSASYWVHPALLHQQHLQEILSNYPYTYKRALA